jgi:hypothetical protein
MREIFVTPQMLKLEQKNPGYLDRLRSQEPPPQPKGPGTELKKLLSWFGFEEVAGCKCGEMSYKMDSKGPAWCESPEGFKEIMLHLELEAAKRGLPFMRAAAASIVTLAISRAKRA